MGDVVGILDKFGDVMVEYNYDAWGKPVRMRGILANAIGRRNPFMYRGYILDSETDMYYLTNRYYTPVRSDFISSDLMIDEKSSYAYCSNNPIMLGDWSGQAGEKSESSGSISDFMRDGFYAIVYQGNYHYNPKHYGCYEKIDRIVMYIPYQDIQYYVNAQYYNDYDPIEFVQESILDETVSAAVGKAADVIDELYAGYGKRLSFLLSLIDIGNKFSEKLENQKLKEKQEAAHQKAVNRKTGLIVDITQTTLDRYLIGAFGWEHFGKTRDIEIQYYEATDYFNLGR